MEWVIGVVLVLVVLFVGALTALMMWANRQVRKPLPPVQQQSTVQEPPAQTV